MVYYGSSVENGLEILLQFQQTDAWKFNCLQTFCNYIDFIKLASFH